MPSLTVRAYAELLHTPLHGQIRILNDQKNPKETPGKFKVSYYQPALHLVSGYFRNGKDASALPTRADQFSAKQEHKRKNNLRIIAALRRSSLKDRKLSVRRSPTWTLTLSNVILRCTPDLLFEEDGHDGIILLDCRGQAPEVEIIRTTVELFHHTLAENGVAISMRHVEYVHLETDTLHRWNMPRTSTIKIAKETARVIETLWESI